MDGLSPEEIVRHLVLLRDFILLRDFKVFETFTAVYGGVRFAAGESNKPHSFVVDDRQ
jgi:hypothetical protein